MSEVIHDSSISEQLLKQFYATLLVSGKKVCPVCYAAGAARTIHYILKTISNNDTDLMKRAAQMFAEIIESGYTKNTDVVDDLALLHVDTKGGIN